VESGGGRARILVIDSGRGVEPGLGERAFDPFVTTRAEGTGLGLPLVRRIAEEHGGSVSLSTRPEGGAVAVLDLKSSEESG
jgi:nitrogen fixation/metabolism regulation signal transduction histidine kinase